MTNTILFIEAFIIGFAIFPKTIEFLLRMTAFPFRFWAFYFNFRKGNFLKKEAYTYKAVLYLVLKFIRCKNFNYIDYDTRKVLVFKNYYFFKCIDLKDYVILDKNIEVLKHCVDFNCMEIINK